MNATERARRSDALYYDSISRRELCDRIADLESDMDSHRALCDMIANLESDLTESKAENAKLRELVADMWNEGMCECGSRGKCARCEYGYPDRMRELGVEVNDGN